MLSAVFIEGRSAGHHVDHDREACGIGPIGGRAVKDEAAVETGLSGLKYAGRVEPFAVTVPRVLFHQGLQIAVGESVRVRLKPPPLRAPGQPYTAVCFVRLLQDDPGRDEGSGVEALQ